MVIASVLSTGVEYVVLDLVPVLFVLGMVVFLLLLGLADMRRRGEHRSSWNARTEAGYRRPGAGAHRG